MDGWAMDKDATAARTAGGGTWQGKMWKVTTNKTDAGLVGGLLLSTPPSCVCPDFHEGATKQQQQDRQLLEMEVPAKVT